MGCGRLRCPRRTLERTFAAARSSVCGVCVQSCLRTCASRRRRRRQRRRQSSTARSALRAVMRRRRIRSNIIICTLHSAHVRDCTTSLPPSSPLCRRHRCGVGNRASATRESSSYFIDSYLVIIRVFRAYTECGVVWCRDLLPVYAITHTRRGVVAPHHRRSSERASCHLLRVCCARY